MKLTELPQDKTYSINDVLENQWQIDGQVIVGSGAFNLTITAISGVSDFQANYSYSLSETGYVYIQYNTSEKYLEEFLAYAEQLVKDLKEQLL